jgi:high-affinity iron transporter
VRTLRRVVRHVAIDPLEYATRAHEILEDAQRDMLSGRSAPWSGAGVQATADSLAATREVIGTLRPLLDGRGDALVPVQTGMLALGRQLAAVRRAHGGAWPALGALRSGERERIDGSLGALLEALSGVPGSLETTLTPVIPTIAEQRR